LEAIHGQRRREQQARLATMQISAHKLEKT
jgi:hypothetical protein